MSLTGLHASSALHWTQRRATHFCTCRRQHWQAGAGLGRCASEKPENVGCEGSINTSCACSLPCPFNTVTRRTLAELSKLGACASEHSVS